MMNDFVFQWIINALPEYDDQHIILENQDGPIPDDEFITFALLSVGSSDYSFTKEEIVEEFISAKETVFKNCKLVFSVNVYSDLGDMDLNQLDLARTDSTISKLFYDNNVSYHGKSDTRSIPKMGDTRTKQRFQADFSFSIFTSRERIIELIRLYRFGYRFNDETGFFEVDLTEG